MLVSWKERYLTCKEPLNLATIETQANMFLPSQKVAQQSHKQNYVLIIKTILVMCASPLSNALYIWEIM
jgi:hypothetical protein